MSCVRLEFVVQGEKMIFVCFSRIELKSCKVRMGKMEDILGRARTI